MKPPAPAVTGVRSKASGAAERTRTEVTDGLAGPQAHARIGPYVLLRILGAGGMGEVWLAEQKRPVRRAVALKVIKRGMDTEQVIARFEAERQALSLMDHASIAKIHDAGSTPEGRPFFVMEYVQGIPITEHADQHRLSTRERLDLFCQICAGVQHAHHKAILHRDLKPSNVLVSLQDGEAQVKIIDFGLAKAMGQPLTERALRTQLGAPVGTPAYMSPEQAETTGQDVDTRTDVYSLGMILYELLAGALPFDPESLRRMGREAACRRIREREPERPSARLARLEREQADRIAFARGTEVGKLARQLRGDLDWIVLRCLEKERSRRYGSPQEIVEDLRRHLASRPVVAGPPSLSYRARKFVRRHLVAVGAAGFLVLGLVVGAVGATVGLVQARQAEARARFEAQSSEAVTKMLTSMLAELDPEAAGQLLRRDVQERVEAHWRERGTPEQEIDSILAGLDRSLEGVSLTGTGLRMLDEMILSRSQAPILANLTERPEIAARLEETVGRTYGVLGLTAKAEPHLVRALELRTRELGRDHVDTLGSMNNLAVLYWLQGRYEEAEPLFVETAETRRRVLGVEHPDSLASIHNLATLYNQQGRHDEAEPLFRETLETQTRALGVDHPNTLGTRNNLAVLYWARARFAEAEPLFLEVLEAQRRALGADHPDTLGTMTNLATLYIEQGRYEEAEPLIVDAVERQKRVLGEEHPGTLQSMAVLAGLHVNTGRLETASALLDAVLSRQRRTLGDRHPDLAGTYYALACLAAAQDRVDEALDTLRRAVDLGWSRPRIRTDPSLEAVRGDPEFEAMVAEVSEVLPSGP